MSAGAAMSRPPARSAGLRDVISQGTIHFMGIGGAGMCALAEAIVRKGGRVTGCDVVAGTSTRPLERMGVRVYPGHDPDHVRQAVGVVVSSAVPAEHPELAAARELGIPVWKRAAALGEWVNAGEVVAVAGTHGKTTTTAMITEILVAAGQDPTGFVGGWMAAWESHLRPGRDDLFVVEADEYDRSFHHLEPTAAVVTNLDADHLDIYGDLEGVRSGFARFLEGIRPGGSLSVCADDPGAASLVTRTAVAVRTFGFSAGSQTRGVDLEPSREGSRFRVVEDGDPRGWISVGVPGRHNATNALAAISVARGLGTDWDPIRSALSAFAGVRRRFQRLGRAAGVTVVDDYAHHPREIDAALAAARATHPGERLVAVFQPHLYTRTRDFADAFGRALSAADEVWVTDVYPAREPPIPGVDGSLVVARVEEAWSRSGESSARVRHHGDLGTLPEVLAGALRAGDLCITLGAGSIESVGPELLSRLERTEEDHA